MQPYLRLMTRLKLKTTDERKRALAEIYEHWHYCLMQTDRRLDLQLDPTARSYFFTISDQFQREHDGFGEWLSEMQQTAVDGTALSIADMMETWYFGSRSLRSMEGDLRLRHGYLSKTVRRAADRFIVLRQDATARFEARMAPIRAARAWCLV